jgi:hypothetical protein
MRVSLLLAALGLAACGPSDDAPVTVEGVDPVESDADLAPAPTLQPGDAGLAPEANVTPAPDLAPEGTLQPDSSAAPD